MNGLPKMSARQVAEHIDKLNEIEARLRNAGQREYAQEDDDAFANFRRIGVQLLMDPERVLWVYAAKHIDGITSYLNGESMQRDTIHGRISDLRVYLALLDAMVWAREHEDK